MTKFKVLSRVLATSTISISFLSITSVAHAANLIPQQEGEIKLTNLECLSNTNPKCLDTNSGKNAYTVTSLNYDPQFSISRLFVDKKDTANDYSKFGFQFLAQDIGTNPTLGEYWFRPVAYSAPTEKKDSPKTSTSTQKNVDAPAGASIGTKTTTTPLPTDTTTSTDGKKIIKTTTVETTTVTKQIMVNVNTTQTVYNSKTKKNETKTVTIQVPKLVQDITTKTITQATTITPGKPVEKGALEVGRFQFDFKNPLTGLKLSFFDVEDSKHTGVLSYTNTKGETISIQKLLAGKEDGNLQSLTINDVKSFVVQLGNPGKKYGYQDSHFNTTGDGVNLQLETVPEPGNMAGLGALAMLGIMSRRRKNKAVDC